MGKSKALPAATGDLAEQAVSVAWPAVFQAQQDGGACERAAPAIFGPGNDAGFRKHQAHRGVHQWQSALHTTEVDRSARAISGTGTGCVSSSGARGSSCRGKARAA